MDFSLFTESSLRNHALLEGVSWLDANWMFVSFAGGVLLALWLVFAPRLPGELPDRLRDRLRHPLWWAFMAISLYTLQQFEEHGFDIFGRRYMFVPTYNAGLGEAMGIGLRPRATMLINIAIIWGAFPFWAFMANRKNFFYPATFAMGFSLVNGLQGHLLPLLTATGELRYMPGMVQVAFLLPLGFWVLWSLFGQHGLFAAVIMPLIIGFVAHLVGLIGPEILFPTMPAEIRIPLFVAIMAVLPVAMMPLFRRWLGLTA